MYFIFISHPIRLTPSKVRRGGRSISTTERKFYIAIKTNIKHNKVNTFIKCKTIQICKIKQQNNQSIM